MKAVPVDNGTKVANRIVEKKRVVFVDPNESARGELTLVLRGITPLIQCRFPEKARKQMNDKQQGRAKGKKPPKDPVSDFLEALHVIGERPTKPEQLAKTRFGFPCTGFKASAVRAAKACGVDMVDARGMFFVQPDADDLIELACDEPEMREDPVRISGTTDIRFRPMFRKWAATLKVQYNARLVSAEQLVGWFSLAGWSVGVGEWRPTGKQSSGIYGQFAIEKAEASEPQMES